MAVLVPSAMFALAAPAAAAPSNAAPSCPDVELVFARGTNEPVGLGELGRTFADAVGAQLPGRTLEVYAVDYPATDDYSNSSAAGAADAQSHIAGIVATCPATKIVMGGYSQGAAVTELATTAMPPAAAAHVAAVALFGSPSSDFSTMLNRGVPLPTLNPAFASRAIDLCTLGDPICSAGGDPFAHLSYIQAGMVDQAATFVAGKVKG